MALKVGYLLHTVLNSIFKQQLQLLVVILWQISGFHKLVDQIAVRDRIVGHVDHTAPGHGGRRDVFQGIHLEHDFHIVMHFYAFAGGKTQHARVV